MTTVQQRHDPRRIATVQELAGALSALRVTAARPNPLDDPLTLRELAVLTGLPHSTLGNAESGRHLPSVAVVLRMAMACGVPEEELTLWRDARNRIYVGTLAARRGLPAPSGPVADYALAAARAPLQVPPPAGPMPLEPGWVTRVILAPAIDEQAVADLEPPPVDLADLEPHEAVEHLRGLPASDAVTALEAVHSEQVAAILLAAGPQWAAEYLEEMKAGTVIEAVAVMGPAVASPILRRMPRRVLQHVVAAASPEWTQALIVCPDVSVTVAAEILAAVPAETACEMFRARRCASLEFQRAVRLLEAVPAPYAKRILALVPAARARTLRGRMSAARLAVLTGDLVEAS